MQVRVLLLLLALAGGAGMSGAAPPPGSPVSGAFEPVRSPEWVQDVTRMAFVTRDALDDAWHAGAQVIHTNVVWPYYPLRREGGGLSREEADRLRSFVSDCHRRGMRIVIGLPPFPPVNLVRAHPDWRVDPDGSGVALKAPPDEKNLGTRLGCNVGPWGDYLIDVCGELVQDFGLDGFSFDGNYHPPICHCPACRRAYQEQQGRELPKRVDLDDLEYRRYLVWRGEQLEQHYRRMQQRLKAVRPDAVLMSWSVNAGRYGHLLQSPRSMSTRTNLLFDLPMQEWWLDETNLGGSVAPAFGAAYLRAVSGDRPNAAEPYLMSRGNPYGSESFPGHEQVVRALLAMTNGSVVADSFGWPGRKESTRQVFREAARRDHWITRTRRSPWIAMLVSEQTRQFACYRDIPGRYLPHLYGAFRTAVEEHLPLNLINDWDMTAAGLLPYRALLLPNAVALSDAQVAAVRDFVRRGGGLIATCETSLCDDLGRPRCDFGLADLFGVSYRGRPAAPTSRPALDANFAAPLDERYWRERVGVVRLSWADPPLFRDAKLADLVPQHTAIFRGPEVAVSEPTAPAEVAARMLPEGATNAPLPAIIVRQYGKGRVIYLAAGIDAALWSYAYPYQRRLLARALAIAAGAPFPIAVDAPMCVQSTFWEQSDRAGRRTVIQLFNDLNSAGGHGLPAEDVPLREEAVPVQGIRITFHGAAPRRFHVEPGKIAPRVRRDRDQTVVELPPLAVHELLVGER